MIFFSQKSLLIQLLWNCSSRKFFIKSFSNWRCCHDSDKTKLINLVINNTWICYCSLLLLGENAVYIGVEKKNTHETKQEAQHNKDKTEIWIICVCRGLREPHAALLFTSLKAFVFFLHIVVPANRYINDDNEEKNRSIVVLSMRNVRGHHFKWSEVLWILYVDLQFFSSIFIAIATV